MKTLSERIEDFMTRKGLDRQAAIDALILYALDAMDARRKGGSKTGNRPNRRSILPEPEKSARSNDLRQKARDAAIDALQQNLSLNGQADAVVRVTLEYVRSNFTGFWPNDVRASIDTLLADLLALQETPQLEEKKEDTRYAQPQLRAGEADPRDDQSGSSCDYTGPSCGYAMYGEPAICTCGKCEVE